MHSGKDTQVPIPGGRFYIIATPGHSAGISLNGFPFPRGKGQEILTSL